MSFSLKGKYDIIYAHEEQFAYRLGVEVLKKPEVSAWMIMIPILFVHHMFKVSQYRNGVRSFAENILSTKKKALDKAYNEVLAGKQIPYELEDYFPGLELSEEDKILAEKQVRVIRVMEEHYQALLKKQGQSVEDLIKGVYSSEGNYRRYLNRLAETEKELNKYLKKKVHTDDSSRQLIQEIEKSNQRLREEELRILS